MIQSVTVLISGRGSNLLALHEKAFGYRIGAVISNRSDAPGLSWAKSQGILTKAIVRQDYGSLTEHKEAILKAVIETAPDIVALAGFMMIIQPEFVDRFSGRLVNIHPSLLPRYPGLDTHARALAAGDKQHGASVHFVNAGLDTGPVIAQATVPIMANDSESTLAERTLAVEHMLYPWVIKCLARGDVKLAQNNVVWNKEAMQEGLSAGFAIVTSTATRAEQLIKGAL